jgi:hypothetical protein
MVYCTDVVLSSGVTTWSEIDEELRGVSYSGLINVKFMVYCTDVVLSSGVTTRSEINEELRGVSYSGPINVRFMVLILYRCCIVIWRDDMV